MLGVSQQVERLAELVVLMDPQDMPALAALHTESEAVGTWAEESEQPSLKEGLKAAADLAEKIILNEVDSPAKALESVGKAVAVMPQRV